MAPLTETDALIEIIKNHNTYTKLKDERSVTPKTFEDAAVQAWKQAQKGAIHQDLNDHLVLSIEDSQTHEITQFAIRPRDTLSVQKQDELTNTKLTADQVRKLNLVF